MTRVITMGERHLDAVNVRQLQKHMLPTARYLDMDNPQDILRRGFAEEVEEVAAAIANGESDERISSEIGDVLWYAGEFARGMPDEFNDIQLELPLDIMHNMAGPSTGIEDVARRLLGKEDVPDIDLLRVAAIRLLDSMQPENDALWVSPQGRLNPGTALSQLLFIVGNLATNRGLLLSDSVKQTIQKLADRTRETGVIERTKRGDESDDDNHVTRMKRNLAREAFTGTDPESQAS